MYTSGYQQQPMMYQQQQQQQPMMYQQQQQPVFPGQPTYQQVQPQMMASPVGMQPSMMASPGGMQQQPMFQQNSAGFSPQPGYQQPGFVHPEPQFQQAMPPMLPQVIQIGNTKNLTTTVNNSVIPSLFYCTGCQAERTSRVDGKIGCGSCLCLLPLLFCPLCNTDCQDKVHSCPNCGKKVGTKVFLC